MATVTPQEAADQWASRMAGATEKWAAGVDSVTVSPGQAAARQADAWANNTVAAKSKWATNVAKVSLQDWKTAMKDKGGQRIGPGAQAAKGKFADFMTQLLPHVDRVKGTLPARGSFDQNLNRMLAFSRGMHEFSYKK